MKQQPSPTRAPVQLCLDLPVPEAMHAAGLQDGSRWPYVFRRLANGGGVTERRPALEAWSEGPCVQHHSDTSWTGVYLDVDAGDAAARVLEAADADRVAVPNVLVVRRSSGHAAAGWFLQEPVHKYPGARDAPQRLYRRTVEYYRHVLGGDSGYNGVTFRNAMVAGLDPDEWAVEHPARGAYTLSGGLADYIPKGWRIPAAATTPEGRHVFLFRMLMKRAGPQHVSDDDIRMLAHGWNSAQSRPLPCREVAHVVRHVLRYRDGWRSRPEGYHRADFLERQAARGRRSGEVRAAGLELRRARVRALRDAGWTVREIALATGIPRRTLRRYVSGHEPTPDR